MRHKDDLFGEFIEHTLGNAHCPYLTSFPFAFPFHWYFRYIYYSIWVSYCLRASGTEEWWRLNMCVYDKRILYIVHAKSWTNLFIFIWNEKELKSLIIKFLWFEIGWDAYTLKPLPQMIWTVKETEQWMMEYWVGYEKKIYLTTYILGPHHKCRMSSQFVDWEILLLFRRKKIQCTTNAGSSFLFLRRQ